MEKRIIKTAEYETGLESFLRREFGLTKRQISQAKFRKEGILVNAASARVTAMLHPGDIVSVLLEEETTSSAHLVPYEYPLEILYEDEDVLAVNKPAGMATHPAHGHYQDTLSNAVAAYCRKRGIQMKIRSVGRLDKDTSGAALFAKNQTAAGRLYAQKQEGLFQKRYLALVQGVMEHESGSICTQLEKDSNDLMKMKTASIGHPLLGDTLYHPKPDNRLICRTALHAESAAFIQPFTGEKITVKAAVPKDIKRLLTADENIFL